MPPWLTVIIVIAVILLAVLAALYYFGRKMQRRQVEQEELMDQMAQTVSILVIDKKIMRMKDSGLPQAVLDQTPKYMRRAKVPVVKAKVGSRILVMMADNQAFQILPVKSEAKVVISGIYIREVKSVRGQTIKAPEKKKGFFSRFKKGKEQDSKNSRNDKNGKDGKTAKSAKASK